MDAQPVVLATDGSELSLAALQAGVRLLPEGAPLVVVTVIEPPDPSLVTGSGHAGGVLTPDQLQESHDAAVRRAQDDVGAVRRALGLDGVDGQVIEGSAGPALCDYAASLGAAAIVVGTRGRGGLKRAVLGSVSDHLVRHAPCPVLVVNDHVLDDGT